MPQHFWVKKRRFYDFHFEIGNAFWLCSIYPHWMKFSNMFAFCVKYRWGWMHFQFNPTSIDFEVYQVSNSLAQRPKPWSVSSKAIQTGCQTWRKMSKNGLKWRPFISRYDSIDWLNLVNNHFRSSIDPKNHHAVGRKCDPQRISQWRWNFVHGAIITSGQFHACGHFCDNGGHSSDDRLDHVEALLAM